MTPSVSALVNTLKEREEGNDVSFAENVRAEIDELRQQLGKTQIPEGYIRKRGMILNQQISQTGLELLPLSALGEGNKPDLISAFERLVSTSSASQDQAISIPIITKNINNDVSMA